MATTDRSPVYTDEIGDEILKAIATSSKGIPTLCKMNPHWPCHDTIRSWIRDDAVFSDKYARAKIEQASFLAEECLIIADEGFNDTQVNDEGKVIVDHDHIQRSRLRVDTRKWLASKLAPKIYGDRSHTEHSGTLGLHETAIKELE